MSLISQGITLEKAADEISSCLKKIRVDSADDIGYLARHVELNPSNKMMQKRYEEIRLSGWFEHCVSPLMDDIRSVIKERFSGMNNVVLRPIDIEDLQYIVIRAAIFDLFGHESDLNGWLHFAIGAAINRKRTAVVCTMCTNEESGVFNIKSVSDFPEPA